MLERIREERAIDRLLAGLDMIVEARGDLDRAVAGLDVVVDAAAELRWPPPAHNDAKTSSIESKDHHV